MKDLRKEIEKFCGLVSWQNSRAERDRLDRWQNKRRKIAEEGRELGQGSNEEDNAQLRCFGRFFRNKDQRKAEEEEK